MYILLKGKTKKSEKKISMIMEDKLHFSQNFVILFEVLSSERRV